MRDHDVTALRYTDSMANRRLGRHYIKQWRKHRGYSLRKLAGMMEREPGEQMTSHANIGRIENFEQPYSQEILEALAIALQSTVTNLLTVDPSKDGDVVDIMQMIVTKDRDTVLAILAGLPDKTGTDIQ